MPVNLRVFHSTSNNAEARFLSHWLIDGEARHKRTMSEHLIREAKFLLRVASETSADKLRAIAQAF